MTRQPLDDRSALVTGASQGLGAAIAREFAAAGADLFLCARDGDRLEATRRAIAAEFPARRVLAVAGDVSKPDAAARIGREALDAFPDLRILVNNAGVYGPKGAAETADWRAWVEAVEVNLFGSVLMCRALVPQFKLRGFGKVIQISGGGATAPLPNLSAYAASKAAVIRFAETLAEELRPYGIDVNAVAPGALNTRMLDEVVAAGPDAVGQPFYDRALQQKSKGGTPLERGAALCTYLASAASDGITGKLISAVWDPWETFAHHRRDLEGTDVYTLRRIVPGDRDLSWGTR